MLGIAARRLVGLVSIERLRAADSNSGVEDIMDRDPPRVAPDTDQECAARGAVDRHECSLPVSTPTAGSQG